METNMTSSSREVSRRWEGNPYGIFDEPMRGAAMLWPTGRSARLRAAAATVEYSYLSMCSRKADHQGCDALGYSTEEDMRRIGLAIAASVALIVSVGNAHAQQSTMSFFVTSTGSGKGADFGGIVGADKHCQALAAAAGAGNKTWRAYLSASATANSAAVNARDRIGTGPWQNAKGVVIAKDSSQELIIRD